MSQDELETMNQSEAENLPEGGLLEGGLPEGGLPEGGLPEGGDEQFEDLLDYLKGSRGFDFTGYKRASLVRRTRKRMQGLGINDFETYLAYLKAHPQEFTQLFNTILINVTTFFRDTATWEYLAGEIIPHVMASTKPDDSIRVWCAGVASGEEAYSIAMLLAEALGEEQFRERVKIYATDVDEDALSYARLGTYTAKEVADIPPAYLEKYFETVNHTYVFRKVLRRSVIFGRLDLVQDAPISHVHLLICRNTLMYFNSETQQRILTRFHFAMNPNGYLVLGKAEMLFTYTNLFTPIDQKRRIFAKIPQAALRERLYAAVGGYDEESGNQVARQVRFRSAAFDANPVPQVVFDVNRLLALANEQARQLFGLTRRDLDRALDKIDFVSQFAGLRTAVDQAYTEHRSVTLREASYSGDLGETRFFDVLVVPLFETASGAALGTSIVFTNVTAHRRLQQDLQHTNEELETAYEELQSSNEELETTNEELQSTVEELETTNEELQSGNEELETMNEELQSGNEELSTLNDELRLRSDELNESNTFLESILSGLMTGVIVLDRELRVQIWNARSEDMWGVRKQEVEGRDFFSLDIGLPVAQLHPMISEYIARPLDPRDQATDQLVLAVNRRGREIHCRVTCAPFVALADTRLSPASVKGVILLVDELVGDHKANED